MVSIVSTTVLTHYISVHTKISTHLLMWENRKVKVEEFNKV